MPSYSRKELMTILKATKPYHGVRNLSDLSKPELQNVLDEMVAQNVNGLPGSGGNFFSDLLSGFKKGAELVSKPLSILEKIPGVGPAVFAPIRTVTEAIKGGQKRKVRIKLRNPGVLHPFGYYDVEEKSPAERHRALDEAIASGTMSPTELWRRINVLMVFNKNNPQLRDLFKSDRDYIKKKYMIGRGGNKMLEPPLIIPSPPKYGKRVLNRSDVGIAGAGRSSGGLVSFPRYNSKGQQIIGVKASRSGRDTSFEPRAPRLLVPPTGGCSVCQGKCRGGCKYCRGACGSGRSYG
jgi:hypothetical protein